MQTEDISFFVRRKPRVYSLSLISRHIYVQMAFQRDIIFITPLLVGFCFALGFFLNLSLFVAMCHLKRNIERYSNITQQPRKQADHAVDDTLTLQNAYSWFISPPSNRSLMRQSWRKRLHCYPLFKMMMMMNAVFVVGVHIYNNSSSKFAPFDGESQELQKSKNIKNGMTKSIRSAFSFREVKRKK